MPDAERLSLKYVPLSTIVRWPENPKRHSKDDIRESIRRRGFRDPPAFDSALGALVEGNGRAEVLEEMQAAGEDAPRGIAVHKRTKAWSLPVLFGVDAESAEAAAAYGLDHNSLTLGPGFDVADVARLYDADALSGLVAGWGSNGDGFEGLVLDFTAEEKEPEPDDRAPVPSSEEEAAALVEKWGTALGQVWTIGRHRLMCGDATKAEDVATLLADKEIELLLTDPPYNVGEQYSAVDDRKTAESYRALLRDAVVERGIAAMIITPGVENLELWFSWEPFDSRHVGIWVKTNSMTRGYVSRFLCWEPILFSGLKREANRTADVFDYPTGQQGGIGSHPCPKPLDLWKELCGWSPDGGKIYDPFCGAGTTVLAAEELGRTCYSMEIDPVYVAVTLERCEGRGIGPIAKAPPLP